MVIREAARYEIEYQCPDGVWRHPYAHMDCSFASEAEAKAAIEQLRSLDAVWAGATFRVIGCNADRSHYTLTIHYSRADRTEGRR